jgi:hypothetical protein
VCFFLSSFGQTINVTPPKKGKLYLMWGYNCDWFSKSDIHLKGTYENTKNIPEAAQGKEYDFTLNDADAHDAPRFNSILNWEVTIPQFYYRVGYLFNSEKIIGIEVGFDHVKYIMTKNQTLHVQGTLYDSTTKKVDEVDREMVVGENFVQFEHTNGANYLMASFVRGFPIVRTKDLSHTLDCLVKPGAGIVIPRSYVSINGESKDNRYHVAGYVAGLDVAFRYTYVERVFFETSAKTCYANYLDVLTTVGNTAHHHFTSFEWMFAIGYNFHL